MVYHTQSSEHTGRQYIERLRKESLQHRHELAFILPQFKCMLVDFAGELILPHYTSQCFVESMHYIWQSAVGVANNKSLTLPAKAHRWSLI